VTAKLFKLEEGEYNAPFGRVIVSRVDGGYKIVVYVSEKAPGWSTVRQMLQSLVTAGGENPV